MAESNNENNLAWGSSTVRGQHTQMAGQDILVIAYPIDVPAAHVELLVSRMFRALSKAEIELQTEDPEKLKEEMEQRAKMIEFNSRPGNAGTMAFHHPWVKEYEKWAEQLPKL